MTGDSVPSIRFAGTDNSWTRRALGEVSCINPKSAIPEQFEYIDLASVSGTELLSHRLEQRASAPLRAQRLAQPGDIFYQTVRPYQKNNYFFTNKSTENQYVFSTGYAQLRPEIDGCFLFSSLLRDEFLQQVLIRCTGTGYPAINANDLAEIEISVPKDPTEQEAIGSLFHKLDNLLDASAKKIEKLKQLKATMLTKMFPQAGTDEPDIRFEGFSGAWESRRIIDEVTIFGGLTYSPSDISNRGTLVLRSSNVHNGHIVTNDCVHVRSGAVNVQNVRVNDIVMVVRNGSRALIGKHAMIKHPMPNTVIGAFMACLRAEQPTFINALFSTKVFVDEVAKSMGATINQITLGMFEEMAFLFPSDIGEQQAIGTFFHELDELIDGELQMLEKLHNLKSAFLRSMFV
ncbi:restriction endonuclease subunit S [Canibacter zhoujuaniae]|uniref:restriction endonuclease subunit S n=1 Tax=Canibacter zhoujuaniae TaxID=2708343 RepID=UPI00141F6AEA|nr:restriction endonuclease subunit S [Canibacter zhoujuaniae]